jgi:dinuclear metal center YbgI/SA1388 family protein
MAARAGVDLLLVHHGLFWSKRQPWTGRTYELLRAFLDNDVALYSSHLPLDAHPRLGNNARLCAALRFRALTPFFECKGRKIGFKASADVARDRLRQRLERVLGGGVRLLPGGPTRCRRIGVVSGGAGADLAQAAEEGVDTLITGEGPHWTYALAEEMGINVLYGGHYATETFGVKALAAQLSDTFGLPWEFLDHPTGL